MTLRTKELVDFIQERCLWQFYSRAWDREENINGVLSQLGELLSNKTPKLDTPMDRCHFANANHLAREVRNAFPWLDEMSPESLNRLIGAVMAKLEAITITQSKNGELHMQAY